jgi:methylase of polypeptide subunit release factors
MMSGRTRSNSAGVPAATLQLLRDQAAIDLDPARKLIAKHEGLSYPFRCEFGGARLLVTEGVFCPTLTNASPLLLDALDFRPHEHVMEAFAGSGAMGILAALHGASSVVLVDTSAVAVSCALANAELNGVADRVAGRVGTVVSTAKPAEMFDLIIANPPLLPVSAAVGVLTGALFDPGLASTFEFIDLLPQLLKPAGRCYLLSSSVADLAGYDLDGRLAKNNLVASIASKADFGYESYRVHKLTLA